MLLDLGGDVWRAGFPDSAVSRPVMRGVGEMWMDRLVGRLPIRSQFVRSIAGSIAVALLVSLGMVWGATAFGVRLDPVLPASFAAVAAALFASAQRPR